MPMSPHKRFSQGVLKRLIDAEFEDDALKPDQLLEFGVECGVLKKPHADDDDAPAAYERATDDELRRRREPQRLSA
jgi:hypothetical protein